VLWLWPRNEILVSPLYGVPSRNSQKRRVENIIREKRNWITENRESCTDGYLFDAFFHLSGGGFLTRTGKLPESRKSESVGLNLDAAVTGAISVSDTVRFRTSSDVRIFDSFNSVLVTILFFERLEFAGVFSKNYKATTNVEFLSDDSVFQIKLLFVARNIQTKILL